MSVAAGESRLDVALDTSRSYAVDGGSGTGKSELCLRRYLILLGQARQPEEVLFVVDGDRHARRVRARVLGALVDEQHPDHSYAAEVRARSAELEWDIAAQPERLQIHTLESLARRIVAAAPVTSRCGAGVRLTEEPESYYRLAARALLRTLDHDERVAPNLETLLLHLDNDLLRAERLLAGLLRRRVELQHCLEFGDEESNRAALESELEAAVTMALAELAKVVPAQTASELAALVAQAATDIVQRDSESPLQACRELRELPATTASHLEAWRGIATLLLGADGEIRVDFGAEQGLIEADAQARMEEVARELRKLPGFASRLGWVRDMSEIRYTDLQWKVLQSLLAVLPRVIEDLKRAFRALGEMDLTELLQGASSALESGQVAVFGADGLQHLVVDDYPELPLAGVELLVRLTANWSDEDRRSTFVTGNPYGSVQRSAGAQPALYLAARTSGLGRRGLEPLELTTSRRASQALLDWSNSVFGAAAADGTVSEGAMPFRPVREAARPGGEVILTAVSGDFSAEARWVADFLDERPELRDGSVAVLLGTPAGAGAMVDALRERGLPCSSEHVDLLGERPVVRDLHALSRALLHLGDRVAWLSVLRAPWCGLTLADLHALVSDAADVTVWELIIDERRRSELSEDGQQRVSRIKRVVAQTLAERGKRDLRRLVEGVWTALGGAVCVADEHELRHARAYFELLSAIDDGGEPDSLEALDAAVARLRAQRPAETGDIFVSTIRHARRRVYDTVVLAGLSAPVPRPEQDDALRWLVRPGQFGEAQLLLAPVMAETEPGGINRWLEDLQGIYHDHELRRLLYVGAGRARERLVVVAAPIEGEDGRRAPQPHSPLATVWPQIEPQLPAASSVAAPVAPRGTGRIRRLPSSWLLPEAPQPKVWNVPRQAMIPADEQLAALDDDGRLVAGVMTRTLAEIAAHGPPEWAMRSLDGLENHLQRMLAMMGMREPAVRAAADRASVALRELLESKRGRWVLDAHHREAYTPMRLTGWLDEQLTAVTIDRSFIDEKGTRWLIEYQFPELAGDEGEAACDAALEAARPRLRRHARLVRRLETTTVRTAVFFPLSAGWREWDPTD